MKHSIVIVVLFFSSFVVAQKDSDILFKVAQSSISVLEFKNVYEKNLALLVDDDQKNVESYLDLFIKFKLKLAKAYQLKLDESRSYKREIETYRNQLIAPYLQDSSYLKSLVKDAYFRTKYKVNASHVLVKLPKGIAAKDTLQYYNRILKARAEVVAGKDFSKVALEYSDDQSVKRNFGNLGYFTAFKMVYPFENAVYNTKVGEVSMPFKTRFGYHFVKVNDLKKSDGEIEVAHILITDKSLKGKQKIDSIYKALNEGADFTKLVQKYSNDKSTVSNAGKLPKFGVGRMMKSFEDHSFALQKEQELTKPFPTRFGWHVVKLLKKHPVTSFEELRETLTEKVRSSGGARMSDLMMLKKLKSTYKITIKESAKSVFDRKDIRAIVKDSLSKPLLIINEKMIMQHVFQDFIRNRRHKTVSVLFKEFINEEVLTYFKENLKNTEPTFARTLQEYKEGLLVFDLMQQEVWNKSSTDEKGLKSYFIAHKSNYSFTDLSENKGKVMGDYQNYLEENLLENLQKKYPVSINKRTLKKIVKYYKKK